MSDPLDPITNSDEFRYYCEAQEAGSTSTTFIPLDHYFKDEDFTNYKAAEAWWPKDAPLPLALPTLHTFAGMRKVFSGAQTGSTTFNDILERLSQRVIDWLVSEKRDIHHPNETPAERKARKNREAQSRFRDRIRVTHGSSVDPELQQRIDVEVEALAELTRTRDATLAKLDAQVLSAHESFLRLCAHRTAERARLAGLVSAQRDLVSRTKRGH